MRKWPVWDNAAGHQGQDFCPLMHCVEIHTLALREKYNYLNAHGNNNIKVTWDLKYLFSLLLNYDFVSGLLRAATNSWKRLEILADNRLCCPEHTVRKCFAILSPILICKIEVYVLVLMYTYKNRKWQAVLTQWWDSRFSVHDHAEWWSKFKKLIICNFTVHGAFRLRRV